MHCYPEALSSTHQLIPTVTIIEFLCICLPIAASAQTPVENQTDAPPAPASIPKLRKYRSILVMQQTPHNYQPKPHLFFGSSEFNYAISVHASNELQSLQCIMSLHFSDSSRKRYSQPFRKTNLLKAES